MSSIQSYSLYSHLFTKLLPICQIGLTGSTYLTIAIAVERYKVIVTPIYIILLKGEGYTSPPLYKMRGQTKTGTNTEHVPKFVIDKNMKMGHLLKEYYLFGQ